MRATLMSAVAVPDRAAGTAPTAGSSRQTACYSLPTGEKAALRAGLRRKTHVISLAYPKRTFAQRKK
jgi:hypothetical protein